MSDPNAVSFTRTLRLKVKPEAYPWLNGAAEVNAGCNIPECSGKHKAHGLCFKHYQRLRKHGDPNYYAPNSGKRAEAKTLGLKRYFTAAPCQHGHLAERTTDTGSCVECGRVRSDAWRAKNLDRVANNERRRYAKAPAKRKANSSRGRAVRALRVTGWTEHGAIADFYALCPAEHEVDHVVPLRGRAVSGLHVLANLQYLPKQENRRKANLFTPVPPSRLRKRRRETETEAARSAA